MKFALALSVVALSLGARAPLAQNTISGNPPLVYEDLGSGSITFIVLHGGPGLTHHYLRPEWDRLARWGRVVYYDQRGCAGDPAATWRDYVSDLDRLRSTLAPSQRVVLAGSSWGAHLALLYAYEHPGRVEALILSGMVAWTWPHVPPSAHPQLREKQACADSILARIDVSTPEGEEEWIQARHNLDLGVDAPFRQRVRRSECDRVTIDRSNQPSFEALSTVEVPTLILRGNGCYRYHDGTMDFAAVLPDAAVHTVAEGGHDPWYRDPDEFFGRVGNFVREELAE